MKRSLCLLFATLLMICGSTSRMGPFAEPAFEPAEAISSVEESAPLPSFEDLGITEYDGFCDVLAAKLIDGSKNSNLSPISV